MNYTVVGIGGQAPKFSGPSSQSLPAGAIGIWDSANYVATPRKTIPNSLAANAPDQNLLSAPRRLFSLTGVYTNNCTTSDSAAAAPDGTNDASVITSASNFSWAVQRSITLAAGTYTAAITAKYLGGGNANFKFGSVTDGQSILTATSSWQRFTSTFSHASGADIISMASPDGVLAANFAIIDFELFPGPSDLHPNPLVQPPTALANMDMVVGLVQSDGDAVSAGLLPGNTTNLIGFPLSVTPASFTVLYVAKPSSSASVNQAVLTKVNGLHYLDFTVGPHPSSMWGSEYNGTSIDATFTGKQQLDGLWGRNGTALFIAGHRYDGASASSFINGAKISNHVISVLPPSFQDLVVQALQPGAFFSGYSLALVAIWNRALSDQEMRSAYNYLVIQKSVVFPRTVIFVGTSITNGVAGTSFAYQAGPNLNPQASGVNDGDPGRILTGVISNTAPYNTMLTNVASAAASGRYILVVEVGANDFANGGPYSGNPNGFTTALASFLDVERALGWKVVIHTILARLDAPDGGVQFNIDRATANSTIRTWVGTHCDAVADWASDPTMGTDVAPNNTTNFNTDKVHPLTAGYTLLEPYTRAAINGIP